AVAGTEKQFGHALKHKKVNGPATDFVRQIAHPLDTGFDFGRRRLDRAEPERAGGLETEFQPQAILIAGNCLEQLQCFFDVRQRLTRGAPAYRGVCRAIEMFRSPAMVAAALEMHREFERDPPGLGAVRLFEPECDAKVSARALSRTH